MKLQDVLHFYVWCPVLVCYNIEGKPVIGRLTPKMLHEDWEDLCEAQGDRYRLQLRPLPSMTKEEAFHLSDIGDPTKFEVTKVDRDDKGVYMKYRWKDERFPSGYGHSGTSLYFNQATWTPAHLQYLLSRDFDLFGLIPAGLALDATKKEG
jgi:hypothetical protein